MRRLFCLFSAFAVLFFCSVPVFATAVMPGGSGIGIPVYGNINFDVVDFWEYLDESISDNFHGYANFVWNLINEDVCPNAPTIGGGHNFIVRRTMRDGQIGKYYVCEYCGRAYGDMLEEAYEEYVETLPGTTVNSDGSFIWKPAPSDCVTNYSYNAQGWFSYNGNGDYVSLDNGRYSAYGGTCIVRTGESIYVGGSSTSGQFSFYVTSVRLPYDGYYISANSGLGLPSIDGFFSVGQFISGPRIDRATGGSAIIPWPEYWVTPIEALGDFDSGFSSDSRVSGGDESSETGFYGYVEEGQLYQSTVRDIFNETSNTYNNPVTGDTSNVENWTYDYSDRSYTLNTDEGDTVTVTYGDTNVTINDGGTTYNVYYLTEHEDIPEHDYVSSVTLEPTCTGTGVRTYTCADCGDTYTQTIPATGHSYQSAVTMPPTCTNTGVRTFTCSVCGDSYTASIPATGHTWQVLQTVSTEFDESGQLLREGYTIYQCSTCGEQYRITADSGGSSLPSPSSGGTSTGNTDLVEIDSSVGRGFLATIAHGLTEDLPEVLRLVSQWFTEIPGLYDGYTKFLAASFAWMPEDCVMLLTFGVGMVVTIAICRAMFRR